MVREGIRTAEGRVKDIDCGLAGIAQAGEHGEAALFGRQGCADEADDAGGAHADIDDGEPGKFCLPGAQDEEEIQGIEKKRFTRAHAGKADFVPGGHARGEKRQGHEAAVRGAQRKVAVLPWRAGTRKGKETHGVIERRAGLRGRRGAGHGGKRGRVEGERIAGEGGRVRRPPGLHGRHEPGLAPAEGGERTGESLLSRRIGQPVGPRDKAHLKEDRGLPVLGKGLQLPHGLPVHAVGCREKGEDGSRGEPQRLAGESIAGKEDRSPPGQAFREERAEKGVEGAHGLRRQAHHEGRVDPVIGEKVAASEHGHAAGPDLA